MSQATLLHEFTTRIPAPREAVFAALTEPGQLCRWFAEQVEVSPLAGRPWRAWGRHTPGAPAAPHPGDVLRELVPPSLLRYAWHLEGCPTEVSIGLAEEEEDGVLTTAVTLRHELAGVLPHPRPAELVDDFWRLTFGNLAAHLSGGGGILLPDFTDPHPEIRLSIVVNASRDAVWRALMEPDALRRWVGATAAEVEPRVGGAYRYGWTYTVGEREVTGGPTTILEMVPDQLLVTDWPDWRGDPAVPVQRIEWHLAPEGSSTRLTLVHRGFIRTVDISDYPFGWAWFVAELKRLVEQA